jgi:transposase
LPRDAKNWNCTKKKTTFYQEADAAKKIEFLAKVEKIAVENRVYVDESGVQKFLYKKDGYGCKGQKIYARILGRRYRRQNFIAAKVGSKIIAPMCYDCHCDADIFNFWVEHFLLPCLKPGQTVIMDNAFWHHSANTKKLIENAKCHILFLPPYSPELNKIERFWGVLKRFIAKILTNFTSLENAVIYPLHDLCQFI